MHRFFIKENSDIKYSDAIHSSNDITENIDDVHQIIINDKDDVKHIIKVLRLKIGQKIEVVDFNHRLYLCEIQKIDDAGNEVICKIINEIADNGESPVHIILYQGLPKGEKFDLIIQKSVELGIGKIVPVIFDRCVVKWKNDKSSDKKLLRWNRIAYEAAKQSKRSVIPVVDAPIDIEELRDRLQGQNLLDNMGASLSVSERSIEKTFVENNNSVSILFYEDEKQVSLKDILMEYRKLNHAKNEANIINIIVGAEGGLEEHEVELLRSSGAYSVSLGSRILRTETAGIVATAIVQYELGDLG